MKTISAQELREKLRTSEALQVIDVRDPSEFDADHVPTAINVPLPILESRVADLRDLPTVLVCHSGSRAQTACEMLRNAHPSALVLEGGTSAWLASGFPTVRTQASRWSMDRQVRLIAGVLVLTGTLGSLVAPGLLWLAAFVGAGLTFAGATNVCGMAFLLAKLPWNRPSAVPHSPTAVR